VGNPASLGWIDPKQMSESAVELAAQFGNPEDGPAHEALAQITDHYFRQDRGMLLD
jgi:hypothetical protein